MRNRLTFVLKKPAMFDTRHRFEWLAQQFELLMESFAKVGESEERKEILRRMKVILDEVDELALREKSESAQKQKVLDVGLGAEVEGSD
jgi:hypothetical protein